jgi:hypothetical protein
MSILLYKIENKNVIRSIDKTLDQSSIYIIVDRSLLRPKIWVWSGPKSKVKDRYFAGVSATTIKSQEKLYGSSIEVVEGGSEPEQFPKMDQSQILEPSSEELEAQIPAGEGEVSKVVEPSSEVISAESRVEPAAIGPEGGKEVPQENQLEADYEVVAQMPVEEKEKHRKAAHKHSTVESASDHMWKQKLKSFMADISRDLESIKNKVDAFLADL